MCEADEIDMFGLGSLDSPFPGIAVEMEWNNKDPFYDRDLNNFQALHKEGAIAVGVIVTRGPDLQHLLSVALDKYGSASTHWDKLIPKVNLGGGGECPLLLVGIEPDRIIAVQRAKNRMKRLRGGASVPPQLAGERLRVRSRRSPHLPADGRGRPHAVAAACSLTTESFLQGRNSAWYAGPYSSTRHRHASHERAGSSPGNG